MSKGSPTGTVGTIFSWMLEQLRFPDRRRTGLIVHRPPLWFVKHCKGRQRSKVRTFIKCHSWFSLLWSGRLNQPVLLRGSAEGLGRTPNTVPKGQPIMHLERTQEGSAQRRKRRRKRLTHSFVHLTLRYEASADTSDKSSIDHDS